MRGEHSSRWAQGRYITCLQASMALVCTGCIFNTGLQTCDRLRYVPRQSCLMPPLPLKQCQSGFILLTPAMHSTTFFDRHNSDMYAMLMTAQCNLPLLRCHICMHAPGICMQRLDIALGAVSLWNEDRQEWWRSIRRCPEPAPKLGCAPDRLTPFASTLDGTVQLTPPP